MVNGKPRMLKPPMPPCLFCGGKCKGKQGKLYLPEDDVYKKMSLKVVFYALCGHCHHLGGKEELIEEAMLRKYANDGILPSGEIREDSA